MAHSNLPISEQFRLTAEKWVEADRAASLMEETKSAVKSEMISKIMMENVRIAVNRAEMVVQSGEEWKEFVTTMVNLRSDANLLKIKMEHLRMLHAEQQSREATARAEMRI